MVSPPPEAGPPPGSWIDRARRRKVVQWTLAYVAGAFTLAEGGDLVADAFAWPAQVQRVLILVLVLGLPIAVVVAWFHGEKGRQGVSGTELVLIAGFLALAGGVLAFVRPGAPAADETAAPPPDGRPSIAVLPFRDLSPGGDQAYFSDGVAEELMTALSSIRDLRIVPRTSAFAFRDSAMDVRAIGQALSATVVLDGSVRKSENALRIRAELVDVADGSLVWQASYDRGIADALDVQAELARAIVSALRPRLSDGAVAQLDFVGQTADPVAQDLFLQGRFAWNRRTRESVEEAAAYFERAIERDSAYARAHVGLADAYAVMGFYDYRPPREAFPAAKAAAARAIAIAPDQAEPYATLGYAALYYDWDFAESERLFLESLARDPGYAVAHQWYSNLLVAAGRFDEGERAMRAATELDPLSQIAHVALGWVLLHSGRPQEAATHLEQSVARDPDYALAYLWAGQALEEIGDVERALVSIERAVVLGGGTANLLMARCHALAGAGREDEAREVLRRIRETSLDGYVPSYEIARCYVALGETEAALSWLERARDERAHSMVFLRVDPQLRALRGDPRFEALVREVGIPVS